LRQTTSTHSFIPSERRGHHGRDRMVLDFQLHIQSVHIIT
jgi:hypothetical protein